jgi:type IV secretion system protein TrbL
MGAAGVALAGFGIGAGGAASGATAGAVRGGAALAGAATTAYRSGGMLGVAETAGAAAISPLRRAAGSLRQSFAAGGRAVTGEEASGSSADPSALSPSETAAPPAWARRMKRNQTITHGATAAGHAVRSGDHPSSGGGVDLSEVE